MTYTKITLEQDLVVIRNYVRKARKDGSYDDLKDNFDQAVLDCERWPGTASIRR